MSDKCLKHLKHSIAGNHDLLGGGLRWRRPPLSANGARWMGMQAQVQAQASPASAFATGEMDGSGMRDGGVAQRWVRSNAGRGWVRQRRSGEGHGGRVRCPRLAIPTMEKARRCFFLRNHETLKQRSGVGRAASGQTDTCVEALYQ
jgi:hypothetical protein